MKQLEQQVREEKITVSDAIQELFSSNSYK